MAARKLKSIHLGTSGWNYKHWKERFYPKDLPQNKWLEFFAERFGTVEINNSFYRLPEKEIFMRWREQTPPDFIFAVKGSRYLTHLKRLKDAEEGLSNFLRKFIKALTKTKHWQAGEMTLLNGETRKKRCTVILTTTRWATRSMTPCACGR